MFKYVTVWDAGMHGMNGINSLYIKTLEKSTLEGK